MIFFVLRNFLEFPFFVKPLTECQFYRGWTLKPIINLSQANKKHKYGSGPLIFENACASAGNIFFTVNFLSVDKRKYLKTGYVKI